VVAVDPARVLELLELLELLRATGAADRETGLYQAVMSRLDPRRPLDAERIEWAASWLRVEHAVAELVDAGATPGDAARWASGTLQRDKDHRNHRSHDPG
jgi:hypothetical protein